MKTIKTLLLLMIPFMVFSQEKESTKKRAVEKRLASSVQTELIRGPYLQVATSNSMTVRWRTDV